MQQLESFACRPAMRSRQTGFAKPGRARAARTKVGDSLVPMCQETGVADPESGRRDRIEGQLSDELDAWGRISEHLGRTVGDVER
jgi:hypothetical protein